jgi:thymidylate synthase
MKAYENLIRKVFETGRMHNSRAGATLAVFGATFEADLRKGFPVITLRKIDYRQAIGELAAFIHGATTVEEFESYGCKYWSAYPNALGPIYGAQWRNFNGVDQLKELLTGLREDPGSRRHMLSTWNPADLDKMVLPPCHLLTQFHVEETWLDCIVYMRSVDIMLGLPYDIIVYALLQELLAAELGLKARKLKFFFGNAHIYQNHFACTFGLLRREPMTLPSLEFSCIDLLNFQPEDVSIIGYLSNEPTKFELNL